VPLTLDIHRSAAFADDGRSLCEIRSAYLNGESCVGVQRIDTDTAEWTAGVMRLLRRAARVAPARSEAESPGSPGRLVALGIDLAADEARILLSRAINVEGTCRSVRILLCCCGQRSSC
jgi:hypothetical protein